MSPPTPPRRRVVEASGRKPPAELRALRVIVEPDLDPDLSYLDEADLAEHRAAYDRGEFTLVGVRVEADVEIRETTQTLESPGVWGVENSEDEYLDEIISEEWTILRNVLKAVGISTDQLPLEASREWIERRT